MGTLFLIGNGFDINCGMHTSYKDVYDSYVKEVSTSETIKEFKKEIASDIENWGDFEMSMAAYAERLGSEAELLECLRDFAKYMENYLLKEVSLMKGKLRDNQIYDAALNELARSLSSFYIGISHNVDMIMEKRGAGILRSIDVISFNYTDIFDIIYSSYMRSQGMGRKNVVHIHGLLQDDPVFGIDNIEQIKASYSLSRKGKRGFIKPIFNEEYDYQRVQQAKELMDNARTICVYGMSLGESDLTWRVGIVEWLHKDENHHLFIYRYSLTKVNYRTVGEKMDIEDDEKERLLHQWGIDINDVIFDQIHIPCGKNIFNIGEVIKRIEKENHKRNQTEIEKR